MSYDYDEGDTWFGLCPHILDSTMWGLPRQYRDWTFPEPVLDIDKGGPKSRPAMIQNWPAQDLAMYCGGEYTTQKGN